ncbi:ninjurin-A-like [Musca vetustissima]|uniref:ninjurin-A-like n=1 Tax=Musca vetustissima TaxID=27455 RepID=UPI002AB737BB|nr:ninjurin-A-like [Musca vetustissima]
MELSISTGVGQKMCSTNEDIEMEHVPSPNREVQENLLSANPQPQRSKKRSPWSCFYCSAGVKVSEDALKAIKSKKDKKENANENITKTDFHNYQQRKTYGQGMMDLALLTANVNQLRTLLDMETKHPYYVANVVFISISIFFQVIVGVSLILNSRVNVNQETDVAGASRVNNFTFACIFIITIVNVFLSVFYDMK